MIPKNQSNSIKGCRALRGTLESLVLRAHSARKTIPSERTLQRWFHQAGGNSAPPRVLPPRHLRSTVVHQCWQVDAVSHQTLLNGQQACWLSATDEASRALLEASVFPPSVL